MKIENNDANDRPVYDIGPRSILADAPFARNDARLRYRPARDGDVMDTREFRRVVRDIVEAYRAEEELRTRFPVAARDLDRDDEKRDVVLRMVRKANIPLDDRAVMQLLRRSWTPELLARFGCAPSPSTVRRWCRIRGHDVRFLSDPTIKSVAERAILGMAGSSSRSLRARRRDLLAVAPAGREVVASAEPAVGDVVHVDGAARRYLGRTMSGRSAYADLKAPAGRRPAVRIDRPDADARTDGRS